MKWDEMMGEVRRLGGTVVCALLAAGGVGVASVFAGLQWGGAGGVAVAAVLAAGIGVVYERLRWEAGVRQVMQLAELARAGEGAAEAVGRVEGRASRLATVVAEVLRDVKRQRAQVAELNAELGTRVRNRTHALEREIGSLRAKAERDGLTGLLNRRYLDEALPGVVEDAVHTGGEVCVVMMDVDHFKQLNDSRGHAAGDEFLKSLSQLIKSSIRPADLAFRQGGDEFVIIMPGASRREAEAVGERVRTLVEAFVKPMRCDQPPRVSVGIAALSEAKDKNANGVMKLADAALYRVKQSRGRRAA